MLILYFHLDITFRPEIKPDDIEKMCKISPDNGKRLYAKHGILKWFTTLATLSYFGKFILEHLDSKIIAYSSIHILHRYIYLFQ